MVSKEAQLPAGSAVRFEIDGPGPVADGLTVDVVVDPSGQGRIVADDSPSAPPVTVTLAMDFATLAHLACGRKPPADCVVEVSGDADQAARVLEVLAITP